MSEQVEKLLSQLFTGAKAEASDTFAQIMAEKASKAIDTIRQSAMDKQFNESVKGN